MIQEKHGIHKKGPLKDYAMQNWTSKRGAVKGNVTNLRKVAIKSLTNGRGSDLK